MKQVLLSFIFLVFLGLFSFGQNYTATTTFYTQADGLSHNQVYWSIKDNQGMMWIGTANGINQFDGKIFELVEPMRLVKQSDNPFIVDAEDFIWLRRNANKELFFFNTRERRTYTFQERFKDSTALNANNFRAAIRCENNEIVIGTNDGQLIFLDSAKQFTAIEIDKTAIVEPICQHKDGKTWLVLKQMKEEGFHRSTAFICIDKKGNIIRRIPIPNESSWANCGGIGIDESDRFLYYINDEIFEIGTDGRTTKWTIVDPLSPISTIAPNFVRYNPEDNLFWIATENRNLILNKEKGMLINLAKTHKELVSAEKYDIYLDDNICWIGSHYGLYKVELNSSDFKHLLYKSPTKHLQSDYLNCRSIATDDKNNVYVHAKYSLYKINKDTEKIVSKTYYGEPLDTYFDKRGYIWTTINKQVVRMSLTTGEKYFFKVPTAEDEFVWSFFLDKNNRVWCGTEKGRILHSYRGSDTLKVFNQYNGFNISPNATIYAIKEDREGRIWVVSTDGLFQLDLEMGIVDRFWIEGDSTHYLPSQDLRDIYQDKDGSFWLGSLDGLIHWDKENHRQKLITTRDGLSDNHIMGIYEDNYGFLWLNSDKGIIQFQKSTGKTKIYLEIDGITNNEFNRISHHQAGDGTIYFGGVNGVTYFHPKDFVQKFDEQPAIPLVLTECNLLSGNTNQQEDKLANFLENKEVVMAANDRYLTIQFALLDYTNSRDIEYAYSFDGEKWNTGKDNRISIGALPYGNHLLTVKGKTGNGLFSKDQLKVPIIVLKPFYLQWWFIVFTIGCLGFVIYLYQKRKVKSFKIQQEKLEQTVQERTATIQEQTEELQKMNELKSRFLANISHEFRTPLTLLLNTLEEHNTKPLTHNDIAEGRLFGKTEVDIMHRNARRLETLTDQLLDLTKLEARKIELNPVVENLYTYLKNLSVSFSPLAQQKNIDLQFITNDKDVLLSFDRECMDKIFYNLLFNAIKFTHGSGSILIDLQKNTTNVWVSVKDTGIGIPESDLAHIFDRFYQVKQSDEFAYEGTGLGLSLVKELSEMHGGTVAVKSELGIGTTFTLSFPLPDDLSIDTANINDTQILPSRDIKPIETTIMEEELNVSIEETDTEKPILLIIEDNVDLRYHQKKTFKTNYQVLLAKNGKEGLDMAFQYIPDLIICDVMMPKKNGYEVCQELKTDERTNHIPIILLTAKVRQTEKIQGLTAGAEDYITKPYNRIELELKVQNLLKQAERQRTLNKSSLSGTPTTSTITPEPTIDPFVTKIIDLIEKNLNNQHFGVEQLSDTIGLSRSQLFRKLKALTGETPTNFLRSYRLNRAKEMLNNQDLTPTEIAYMVGFSTPNYFFKSFKKEFGMTPTEMLKQAKAP